MDLQVHNLESAGNYSTADFCSNGLFIEFYEGRQPAVRTNLASSTQILNEYVAILQLVKPFGRRRTAISVAPIALPEWRKAGHHAFSRLAPVN